MKAMFERAAKLKAQHDKRDDKIKLLYTEFTQTSSIKRKNEIKRAIQHLMDDNYGTDIQHRTLTATERENLSRLTGKKSS